MIKRQLTYFIPLQIMCQTGACQAIIAKEAININRNCLITYESLHTARDTLSTMIVTMVVDPTRCDYIHRAMQQAIAVALSIYSPDTDMIHVNDIPVATRDFNPKEIL